MGLFFCLVGILAYRVPDIQRLEEWVKQYRLKLERYCARLVHSEEEGVDAAQDAVIRAFRYWSSFDQRYGIDRWMFTIARNVCLERRKRVKTRPQTVPIESAHLEWMEADEDEGISGLSDREEVLSVINSLPVEDQEVLYLVDVLEIGHRVAAFALGETMSKLRWRLWAARDAARAELGLRQNPNHQTTSEDTKS